MTRPSRGPWWPLVSMCALLVFTGPAAATTFVQQSLPGGVSARGLAFGPTGRPGTIYRGASPTFYPWVALRNDGYWDTVQVSTVKSDAQGLIVDNAFKLHVLYKDITTAGSTHPLEYARLSGSWSFDQVTTAALAGSRTCSIAFDSSNNAWVAFAGTGGYVYVAIHDPSGGWDLETVGLYGGGAEEVNLVISPSGVAAVTYSVTGIRKLYCAVRVGANDWDDEEVASYSTLAAHRIDSSVAINGSGQPVVAYYVPSEVQRLYVRTRTADNTWTTAQEVVSGALSNDYGVDPKLDIDSSGDLHVVYNDEINQLKRYIKRTGASSWGSAQTITGASYSDFHYMRVSVDKEPRVLSGNKFFDAAWGIARPTAGTSWTEGTSQLVAWHGSGTATVEYSINAGSSWTTLASGVLGDDATITVPSVSSTTSALIRVTRSSPSASSTVSVTLLDAPPAQITDAGFEAGKTTGALWWTSPGGDGNSGQAAEYQVRYNINSPVSELNWSSCSIWTSGVPSPSPAGTLECVEMWPLTSCRTYYWGIKTRDAANNWSVLSNVPHDNTLCSGYQEVMCMGGLGSRTPEVSLLPDVLSVGPVSPNPVRSVASLELAIPAAMSGAPLDVRIFDVTGRLVRSIATGTLSPGSREITWDLRDGSGAEVPNGVYFVRVSAGDIVEKRRMLLAR